MNLSAQHDLNNCSGGWDRKTGAFNTDINAQIDQAFENVGHRLRDADGKGWSQVFRINDTELCEVDAGPQAALDMGWGD